MQKVYFISGVSGVGKTSTLKHLKNMLDENLYNIRDLDERGVPDGGGIEWLKSETRYWLDIAKENSKLGKSTIICGFANPELFDEIYKKDIDIPAKIILLNISSDNLRKRLEGRHDTLESVKEIERASGVSLNEFIENNIKFLSEFKKIFEDRGLPIIETDDKTPEIVSKEVIDVING